MSAPKSVKLDFKLIRAVMRDWKRLDAREAARKRKGESCPKQSSQSSASTR